MGFDLLCVPRSDVLTDRKVVLAIYFNRKDKLLVLFIGPLACGNIFAIIILLMSSFALVRLLMNGVVVMGNLLVFPKSIFDPLNHIIQLYLR